jgi:cysteine rich repeat protein
MKIGISLVVFCIVALTGGIAAAEQKGPAEAAAEKIVQTVADGCKTELETYCKNVTVGEGRVLACLYAYEDKLSARCEYALYDASAQLERAITTVTYVANECRDDLTKFCSNIKIGEGRVLQCLDKNSSKVSSRCKQALKDTGLK